MTNLNIPVKNNELIERVNAITPYEVYLDSKLTLEIGS